MKALRKKIMSVLLMVVIITTSIPLNTLATERVEEYATEAETKTELEENVAETEIKQEEAAVEAELETEQGELEEVTESKTAMQSEAEQESEAVTESESEEESEAVTESKGKEESEAVIESESEKESEAVTESETKQESEAVTESESEEESEAVTESETMQEETTEEMTTEEESAIEETTVVDYNNTTSAVGEVELVNTVDLSKEWDISAEEVKYTNKKVLLIQDTIPWNRSNSRTDSNQEVLKGLAAYDVTTTAVFPKMDISDYAVIIFANDQSITTYTNYSRFTEKMEEFAELGGIIVFGAADGGWASGSLNAPLPGGVTKTSRYTYYNEVVASSHPIVTGQLTDNRLLEDANLYGNYCSHVYFNESTFPAGTNVILKEKNGYPTLIEYPLGRGRVIASGLTWEHNYVYGGSNDFGKKSLDDLYSYALYISGINNENLDLLLNSEIKDTQHLVVVADAVTHDPIKGATVTLGTKKGISDENGRVWFDNVKADKKLVTVTADAYQMKIARYDVNGGDMHYFFMTKEAGTDMYIIGAVATEKKKDKDGNLVFVKSYDLLEESVSIRNDRVYEISLYGEWGNHEKGEFALYLDDKYAYTRVKTETLNIGGTNAYIHSGNFTIIDGKCSNSKGEEVAFSGGRIHARMIDKAGNRSSGVELKLFAKKDSSGSLFGDDNSRKFSIGEKIGFTIPDKYPVVGNMDFNVSLDMIPFCYEVSDGEIKIAIGISDFANIESPGKTWDDYIKKFRIIQSTKNLKEVMKGYGAKSGSFNLKDGWDTPELEVVGYATGKYDETTGEVTNLSGELVVSTGLMYSYSQQFIVGPVPLYFEIGGGFSLENDTKIEAIMIEEGQLVADNTLTLTPKFTLGGGVGINGALSAGATGEATLPIVLCDIKHNYSDDTIDFFSNVSLTGEMKLTASVLFVFSAEKSIAKGEWQILRYYWDSGEMEWFEADDIDAQTTGASDLTDINEYQLMSRSYQKYDDGWYTENLSAAAYQDGMTVLQTGVLTTSAPQVVQLADGKALMVFQQDNAARSAINRSCLMYSVYSNGVWSNPKAVWDNQMADMAASLVTGEAGTYVVWQKLNKVLSDDASIETMAAACEIVSARFNEETGAFEEAKYLTNDGKLQMLPTVVSGSQNAYALYVENSQNELLGGGINTVYAVSLQDGEKIQLYSGSEYVTTLTGCVKNDKLEAAMILDKDADLNTTIDTDVYVYQAGSLKRITEDESAQMGAQYCDGILYWNENDGINHVYSYDGNNKNLVVESSSLGTNIKVMKNSGKQAIVWPGVTQGGKYCLYSMVKDGNEWSDSIEIVTTDYNIMQFSGYIANDGNWELIATAERSEDEVPVLLYTGVAPYIDTNVSNMVAIDRDRKDMFYALTMDFTNNSETTIDELTVEFVDENGGTVYTRKTKCSVKGGQSKKLKIDVDIPMQKELTEYKVYVYPEGEENIEDNVGTIKLGYADISLFIDKYESGNTSILAANIYNDSDIKSDVTFTVREDDPENGVIVDIVNIDDMEPGATRVFNYSYDLTKMNFNDKPTKAYYYSVIGTAEEINLTNNDVMIEFQNPFYTENGEMAVPTGLNINVPDPVILNLDQNITYQIEAKAEPIAASKWPLEYASSNNAVVTVDDTGLLTAVGEGTATVTVKLQNIEILKQINVQVNAFTGKKLTIKLKELSEKTTGYQVKDICKMQVYSDKSQNAIQNSVFLYTSSNETVATVTEDGTVTMLKPGNVTLKAVYKNNEKIQAVIKIKVEAQKAETISLSYMQNGYIRTADSLFMTPKQLTDNPISVMPMCYAENGDVLENVSYTYTSSNKAVANVDAKGNVKAGGKEGTAIISVSVKNTNAVAELPIYVYTSYEPVLLSDSSITVNTYKTIGTNIVIQPIANTSISNYYHYLFEKNKDEYTVSYDYSVSRVSSSENGSVTYAIKAAGTNLKAKEYYLRTMVNGSYYYTRLKIKPVQKFPSVTVKLDSFNPFYTDQYGKIILESDEDISYVRMSEVANKKLIGSAFSMSRLSNEEYSIRATSTLRNGLQNGTNINQYNKKYKLYISVSGYNTEIIKDITIPIKYQKPSIKLDRTSFNICANASRYAVTNLSVKEVGAKSYDYNISSVYPSVSGISGLGVSVIDGLNGKIQFTLPTSLEKTATATVTVKKSNWVAAISTTLKVTPAKKLQYKINPISLNPALGQTIVTGVSTGGQKLALRNEVLMTDELFQIRSIYDGIQVMPIADSSMYTAKKYNYKLTVKDRAGVSLGELPLTISIVTKKPTVKLADKKLMLDVSQRGRMVSTTVSVSDKNVKIVDMISVIKKKGVLTTDITAEFDNTNNKITITGQQKNAGNYEITFTPVLENGEKLATVKLPVVAGQNTAIVTKVKGALDAMKRATSKVYITMNVKNNSADIDKVEIQNAFKSGFEILESDLDKKQITIGIKSAYDIAAGNHQIPLNIYLTDGSKHLAYAKVAVKSTKCTLQKGQKHYMLISAKNMVAEGQIIASIPSDEGIVSIEQVSGQDKFILEDKKSGMYEIRVVQKGKLKKGTYKIKCNVHTENEVKNDKGISYTITIVVK